MDKWSEEFKNHPFHETFDRVKELTLELETQQYESQEILEHFHRMNNAYDQISSSFNKIDPLLAPFGTMTEMEQILARIENDLNSFNDNHDLSNLTAANKRVDNLLIRNSYFLIPQDKLIIQDARKKVTSFKQAIGQYQSNTKKKANEINSRLENLKSIAKEIEKSIEAQKGRLDNIVTEHQNLFQNEVRTRQKDFSEAQKKHEADVSDYLKKQELFFLEELNKTKERSSGYFQKIEGNINQYNGRLESSFSDFEARKQELIEEVEKVVSIITLTGNVGGYQKNADKERNASNFWRLIAFIGFGGLAGLGVFLFFSVISDPPKIDMVITKLFAVSALGVLGVFATRQADKHEYNERKFRKMELELSSINPFLADFEKDEIKKIKERLVDKFFGREESQTGKIDKRVPKNLMDVLASLANALKELMEKWPKT